MRFKQKIDQPLKVASEHQNKVPIICEIISFFGRFVFQIGLAFQRALGNADIYFVANGWGDVGSFAPTILR